MTTKRASVLLVFLFFWGRFAFATIQVVTTLPSFANIAERVGGDEVKVEALTKGTQDPHFVDARPNLILYLNRADLLIRAGLGLEDGWLPPLLTGSRNAKIQIGSEGFFDASSVIQLKEVPQILDRSMGDVHAGGNPHYMLDPRNGIVLAKAIAVRLGKLDPSKAAVFEKRAEDYCAELSKKIVEWESALKPFRGMQIIAYHRSWIYFSSWVGFVEAGYVEPKPGIPPSPDHVVKLVNLMKQKKVKLIVMEPYYPTNTAEQVAREAEAKLLVLPTEILGNPEAKDYISLFGELVKTLKASL